MTGKEIVEAWQTMELLKDLRRHGTRNGAALGMHIGACDIAADEIERLIAEVKRLNALINENITVRHGHWIEESGLQVCSECGEEHDWDDYRAPYCDTCGAKMDEREASNGQA